jgi:hypothetical protein
MSLTRAMADRSAQRRDGLDTAVTDRAINSQLVNAIHCIDENDAGVTCVYEMALPPGSRNDSPRASC